MEELEQTKEICVDTDILIDFLKKKEPGSRAYEHWRSKASVGTTSITVFELLLGAKQASFKRHEEAKNLVEQQTSIYPFDKSAADAASELGAELKRQGRQIEIRDLFIASICISRGIPLLTRNKDHFQRVPALKLL